MKAILLAGAFLLASSTAYATTCKFEQVRLTEAKKIDASFMQKCETQAAAKCEANANDRNLQGAARVDFMKQCFTAAVGTRIASDTQL